MGQAVLVMQASGINHESGPAGVLVGHGTILAEHLCMAAELMYGVDITIEHEGVVMEKIIVGVDAGTTAVKAVAFNLNGEILNAAHRSVPANYGRRGEAEQDLNQIWEAVVTPGRADLEDLRSRDRRGRFDWPRRRRLAAGQGAQLTASRRHLDGWPCRQTRRPVAAGRPSAACP